MKKTTSIILVLMALMLAITACTSPSKPTTVAPKPENTTVKPVDIIVVSREEGSGTRGAFVELTGVEGKDADGNTVDSTYEEAIIQNGTNGVMMTVANEAKAIGYISLGSLNDTVKALQIDGVEATAENVKNGSYKIARPFNVAYKAGLDEASQDLLDFIMSEEGQKIVEERGYISAEPGAPFAGGKVSGSVVVAGSTSVTPVMEKLVEAYNAINPDVTIEIQSTGSSAGMQSTMQGVSHLGMASRELKDEEKAEMEFKVIAIDGIAVIVHKSSTVKSLTMEQVKQIFVGELRDWNLVK